MPSALRYILSGLGATLLALAIFGGLGLLGLAGGVFGIFFILVPVIVKTGWWTGGDRPVMSTRMKSRIEERERRSRWKAAREAKSDDDDR